MMRFFDVTLLTLCVIRLTRNITSEAARKMGLAVNCVIFQFSNMCNAANRYLYAVLTL